MLIRYAGNLIYIYIYEIKKNINIYEIENMYMYIYIYIYIYIYNKRRYLPRCNYVNTTVWMHHKDANKTHRIKASWEPHKNTPSYLKQILEATPHKTTAVRPLTSYRKNHPSKTKNYMGLMWRSQDKLTSDVLHWTSTRAGVARPARTYISFV